MGENFQGLDEVVTHTYLVLLLIGATLGVWFMALVAHSQYVVREPPLLRAIRRASIACVIFGMLWAVSYCIDHRWIPWYPDVLLVVGIDLYFLVAIASSYRRTRLARNGT